MVKQAVKERPILFSAPMVRAILDGQKTMTRRVVHRDIKIPDDSPSYVVYRCPYGQHGDRLWVRETFSQHPQFTDVAYRADGQEFQDSDGFTWVPKWRPSIFMPRNLSRITLEITNVRVERLQDISEEDAKNEGCLAFIKKDKGLHSYKDDFHHLWQSINGPCSWDANPWVWVVEFTRVAT